MDRTQADRFVPGGYERVLDVTNSASGAARWWLENRRNGLAGFTGFVCEQAAMSPGAQDRRW
jgi:hypothetical protein